MESFRRVDEWGNIHYTNENGEYHREDGPALEYTDGHKEWLINDKLHREDGPAIIWHDGDEWYYLNGFKYSKEDWEKEITKIKLGRIKDL